MGLIETASKTVSTDRIEIVLRIISVRIERASDRTEVVWMFRLARTIPLSYIMLTTRIPGPHLAGETQVFSFH